MAVKFGGIFSAATSQKMVTKLKTSQGPAVVVNGNVSRVFSTLILKTYSRVQKDCPI